MAIYAGIKLLEIFIHFFGTVFIDINKDSAEEVIDTRLLFMTITQKK